MECGQSVVLCFSEKYWILTHLATCYFSLSLEVIGVAIPQTFYDWHGYPFRLCLTFCLLSAISFGGRSCRRDFWWPCIAFERRIDAQGLGRCGRYARDLNLGEDAAF
jgi:hypothetical protein